MLPLLLLGNGWANYVEIRYALGDPLTTAYAVVTGGVSARALQWGGNPYGNGYEVEMEWKWGTICETRMDWFGFGAEYSLNTM